MMIRVPRPKEVALGNASTCSGSAVRSLSGMPKVRSGISVTNEDTHIKLAVPKLRLENDDQLRVLLNCNENIVCCGLMLPL